VTTRVFLVDDHEIVRAGLRELLEATGELTVVGEASTAAEANRRIPAARPDVTVIDVRLPDGNGIEVCREARSRNPGFRCLMLTSFSDDEALFDAIMAGASGYMLKDARAAEIVEAVRRVAAGQSLLDPAVTEKALDRIRRGPPRSKLDELSPQELRILELIAEGLTNREIGQRLFLAEKTVKNNVSNMLVKMGMTRRTEAAAFLVRHEERHRSER
jgi:two-component system, NarL family, response regulator DevR